MMELMEIKQNRSGRGVYATRVYKNGDTIEICQLIILGKTDTEKINQTSLYNYYYSWGDTNNQAAIALGNGSLYNHSYTPNAIYKKDVDSDTIRFVAIGDIHTGDEITINYNGDPTSKKKLWFDALET